ncbi:hypothetical protein LMI01_07570 [Companilactobacillus mindensis]|nr:hypothetical protein LMI01_07570 [Companilactobacillus mindensis]
MKSTKKGKNIIPSGPKKSLIKLFLVRDINKSPKHFDKNITLEYLVSVKIIIISQILYFTYQVYRRKLYSNRRLQL